MNNIYSYGNHIFGGELLYTFLHQNTYQVTLTLYGDCGTSNQTVLAQLVHATPIIKVMKGSTLDTTIILRFDTSSGKDVSPVCAADANNTLCNGGTLPGVRKYVYRDSLTLSDTDANWQFIFYGALDQNVGGNLAGRSSNITNIVNNGGAQLIYLVATLNNIVAPDNSSPKYTTIPTPFYCINISEQYNQAAIDINNDSLVFSLTPALNGGTPVIYVVPFSATYPVSSANNDFNFNPLNGQMNFTPDIIQDALVVNKVTEYKNGIEVGSSMREMTFVVLGNCNNRPPIGPVDSNNVVGAISQGNDILNLCVGSPHISFSIVASDPDQDSIEVTQSTLPAGCILNIVNNGTLNPNIDFDWNTTNIPVGLYSFYLTYHDHHCPISCNPTIGYTIQIVSPYVINATQLLPTGCAHQALIQYDILYGVTPRHITIKKAGVTIKTYLDTTGTIIDSLPKGDYTINVWSPYLSCDTTINFSVADGGKYPNTPEFPSPIVYCQFETVQTLNIIRDTAATLNWYNENYNSIPTAPTLNSNTLGTYIWHVSQTRNVCTSDTATLIEIVAPHPVAEITITPKPVCSGDTILLQATGGVKYSWKPTNLIMFGADSNSYTRILQPTTYTVIAYSNYGCTDSATITYSDIEPCCQFSYPNAFTPNYDGKNDRYKVMHYGNLINYEIYIFNRWGQKVFQSNNPSASWDGTFNGKPCEVGTYYYTLHAECVSGHVEDAKGDITLIR
ncbi:MAG: gliding motility-associated C-terminal domain-containing protein [Bacteroidota bacterium]